MKISIIIPAFNESLLLGQTLESARTAGAAFESRGWKVERIVCDNNSSDATPAIARESGARVVFEPVNQIARARNTGAGTASGDWFIFVDADSRPSRELFDEVAGAIVGGRCLGGGATVRLDPPHRVGQAITSLWNAMSRTMKWMAGSFIFCDAAAFRAVGGFDPGLYVAEELDFSKKLKKEARRQGKRIVILNRNPLLTSSRKMKLYSAAELIRFFFRAGLQPNAVMRNRDACAPWYDGRR